MEIAVKKTLKFGFGRRPQHNLYLFSEYFPSKVKIKLHTENQPPSLLNIGDSCEEDLKIWILKTTSIYFQICSQYFV